MVEHDGDVGELLKAIDDLGIADNTIVVYTTDNGPNQWSWPDAATTPFRSEKDTNWEGAFRVPAMVRWPGKIKAGEVSNEMFSGLGLVPDARRRRRRPRHQGAPAQGHQSRRQDQFKVHLDGYNQLPYLTGSRPKSARNEFYYFNDDGELVAYRYDNWKIVFCEQREAGRVRGLGQSVHLPAGARRSSTCAWTPIERADIVSDQYYDWLVKNAYLIQYGVWRVAPFLQTFMEYPPSQRPASFSVDQMVDALMESLDKQPGAN